MENKDIGDSAQSQQGLHLYLYSRGNSDWSDSTTFFLNVYDVINKKIWQTYELIFLHN
jgi:hypothetical protein